MEDKMFAGGREFDPPTAHHFSEFDFEGRV
jgi:hypothetical protein